MQQPQNYLLYPAPVETVAQLLWGRPDRLRAVPAAARDGGGLRRGRAVVDPEGVGRPGEDRPAGARRRLARLHRAGQPVPIRVPSPREEAVRDLCRASAALDADVTRVQHQLSALLLRHGRPWRDGITWTLRHRGRLAGQRLPSAPRSSPSTTTGLCWSPGRRRWRRSRRHLADHYGREPFADPVRRLAAYRGVAQLGALPWPAACAETPRTPEGCC